MYLVTASYIVKVQSARKGLSRNPLLLYISLTCTHTATEFQLVEVEGVSLFASRVCCEFMGGREGGREGGKGL